MSAPPGWHPQPDGRDRWWDGQEWTEHFRDSVPAGQQPPAAAGYGAPAPGYGAPGAGYPPPQSSGMSTGAKGCLIGALVLIIVLVLGAIAAVFIIGRTVERSVDEVRESIGSLPTEIPDGRGEPVIIVLGEGFTLPTATIAEGWSTDSSGPVGTQVTDMTATFAGDQSTPTLFTMKFGDTGPETVCTAIPPESGDTSSVTCVPLFEDVDPDAEVTVTPTF